MKPVLEVINNRQELLCKETGLRVGVKEDGDGRREEPHKGTTAQKRFRAQKSGNFILQPSADVNALTSRSKQG